MMYLKFILGIIFLSFVLSCTKDVDVLPSESKIHEYYPLEIGDVRLYEIDSITYDFDGNVSRIVIDSVHYYQRELVTRVIDFASSSWYEVEVYTSPMLDGEYELKEVVLERIDAENKLLIKKDNLTFIPLAFPLDLFDEWQGTALFDKNRVEIFVRGEKIKPYENWNSILLESKDTMRVKNTVYSDVLRINQVDTASIESVDDMGNSILLPPEKQLFYDLSNEWFAAGKGLVKKEQIKLSSICASSSVDQYRDFCRETTIFENAERGFIYRKNLLNFE